MSKVLQWILGILAVLVVVGLVAGAVFMWRNHMLVWGPQSYVQGAPGAPAPGQQPGAPNEYREYWRYHMGERAWGMPMMHNYGYAGPYAYGPFGGGFMIVAGLFRLLIPLGVLALVAYIFYGMGKRAGASSGNAAPASPRQNPPPARKVAGR